MNILLTGAVGLKRSHLVRTVLGPDALTRVRYRTGRPYRAAHEAELQGA
ncbi:MULTISPECIES: hypothetical protein [Streptomyces]|nr:hypothetical protein [Streptomyces spororaveus]MCM9082287.1 hypothetical protein [Streptomyces spororaveus]